MPRSIRTDDRWRMRKLKPLWLRRTLTRTDPPQAPEITGKLSYTAPMCLIAEPLFTAEEAHSMNRKIVFDLVRDLVGRGFRQSEVEALDDAQIGRESCRERVCQYL